VTDLLGMAIIQAFTRRDIRVPKDVAVMGCGDPCRRPG
jgi:DNA-binding LacI/PurR family transcriptional regulator